MKLNKRLLALLLSVALIIGSMAFGASASITDYDSYDPNDNPYTYKLGLKVFEVDENGEKGAEITNGKVQPGQRIRVEVMAQTNFFTNTLSVNIAYSNKTFVPTKLDGTTYNYKDVESDGLLAEVFQPIYDNNLAEVEGDLSSDDFAPALGNMVPLNYGFVGGNSNNAFAFAKAAPKAWRAADPTLEAPLKSDKAGYNLYVASFGPAVDYEYSDDDGNSYSDISGSAAIITTYKPVMAFDLTVSKSATSGSTAEIMIPADSVKKSGNTDGNTIVGRAYDPDGSFYATPTLLYPGAPVALYKDTYDDYDGSYDRKVDLTEARLSLTVDGEGGTEPPVKPLVPEIKATGSNTVTTKKFDGDETTYLIGFDAKEIVEGGKTFDTQFEVTNGGSFEAPEGFGTGKKLVLKDSSGATVATYTFILFGDVDGDGKITGDDATKIKNHVGSKSILNGCYFYAADVKPDMSNATIDGDDLAMMYNYMGANTSVSTISQLHFVG